MEGTFPEVVYAPRDQAYTWLFTHGVNLAEGKRNNMGDLGGILERMLI